MAVGIQLFALRQRNLHLHMTVDFPYIIDFSNLKGYALRIESDPFTMKNKRCRIQWGKERVMSNEVQLGHARRANFFVHCQMHTLLGINNIIHVSVLHDDVRGVMCSLSGT